MIRVCQRKPFNFGTCPRSLPVRGVAQVARRPVCLLSTSAPEVPFCAAMTMVTAAVLALRSVLDWMVVNAEHECAPICCHLRILRIPQCDLSTTKTDAGAVVLARAAGPKASAIDPVTKQGARKLQQRSTDYFSFSALPAAETPGLSHTERGLP